MKEAKDWSFITSHGLVLLYILQNAQCTTREIASVVKVTERTVHRVLTDLEEEGYITRKRDAKGNIYQIDPRHSLKHQLTEGLVVGDLLDLLGSRIKRNPPRR